MIAEAWETETQRLAGKSGHCCVPGELPFARPPLLIFEESYTGRKYFTDVTKEALKVLVCAKPANFYFVQYDRVHFCDVMLGVILQAAGTP